MATIDEALSNAHEKLKDKQDSLMEEYTQLLKEIEKALNEERDQEYVMPINVKNKIGHFKEQADELDMVQGKFEQLHDSLMDALILEKNLASINSLSFNELGFINTVRSLNPYNYKNIEILLKKATKLTGMDNFRSLSDFKNYCERINTAKIHVLKLTNKDNTVILGDKTKVVDTVKSIVGSNDLLINNFLDYLENLITNLTNKRSQLSKECSEFIEKETYRFVHECDAKVNALLGQKDALIKKMHDVPRASFLYSEYVTAKEQGKLTQKQLNELIDLFIEIGVLTRREVDKLTYEKQEKVEVVDDNTEETITEIKPVVVKELGDDDLEYYLEKDTKNIICFLGEEGNDIYKDLYKNFDNSLRPKVLNELVSLFNNLYANRDPLLPTGSYPIPSEENKKTRTLLKSPFGFAYKRFFTKGKDYRIHAIIRHSSLLEDLGYGSGNIIFFGSLGLNNDEAKNTSYSIVGRRAIEKKSSKSGISKLKPNFDYIEHITRGYIPKSLLSDSDKNKIKTDFLGVIKDTKIDKSVENGEYIYYYLLDDESKKNVYEYLNKYFMKQSTMMFKFIKELEDIKKDSSLD